MDETLLSITKIMSKQPWESKVLVVLAAFAITYGEILVLDKQLQQSEPDPLVKSIAMLKQLHDINDIAETLDSRLEGVISLLKEVIEVIIKLTEMKASGMDDIDESNVAAVDADIIRGAFLTIYSIVACTREITRVTWFKHEMIKVDLEVVKKYLSETLLTLKQHEDDWNEKKVDLEELKNYERINRGFMEKELFESLLCKKGGNPDLLQPLVEFFSLGNQTIEKKHKVDFLKNHKVMLLISDVNINLEETNEIYILKKMYEESSDSRNDKPYKFVWLPIVCNKKLRDKWDQGKYKELQNDVKWMTMNEPATHGSGVFTFVAKRWKFDKKPIVVAIDEELRVVSKNALPMLLVWGPELCYPFSTEREKELWESRTSLSVEFLLGKELVDTIKGEDRKDLVQGATMIVLCGGTDMEWLTAFTEKFKALTEKDGGIQYYLIYAGKTTLEKNISQATKKLFEQHRQPQNTYVFYPGKSNPKFWHRQQAMQYSKWNQCDGEDLKTDRVLKLIKRLQCFDSSDDGWFLIAGGIQATITNNSDNNMVMEKGKAALKLLDEYEEWGKYQGENVVQKMAGYYGHKLSQNKGKECGHGNQILLNTIKWGTPTKIYCPDCDCQMEMLISYRCVQGSN